MGVEYVKLTEAQRANHEQKVDKWIAILIEQARSNNDPETRDNARLLLDARGIEWSR